MEYDLTSPCAECPFLLKFKDGYSDNQLKRKVQGEFPCHKTAILVENEEDGTSEYIANDKSKHCAGALIYMEKRNKLHQMGRICERLGLYDCKKLNMAAEVR